MKKHLHKILYFILILRITLPSFTYAQWLADPSREIRVYDTTFESTYTIDLGAIDYQLFKENETYLSFWNCAPGSALIKSSDETIGLMQFEGATTKVYIFTNQDESILNELNVNYSPSDYAQGPLDEITITPTDEVFGNNYERSVLIELHFNTHEPGLNVRFEGKNTIKVSYTTEKNIDIASFVNNIKENWTLQDYALLAEAKEASRRLK